MSDAPETLSVYYDDELYNWQPVIGDPVFHSEFVRYVQESKFDALQKELDAWKTIANDKERARQTWHQYYDNLHSKYASICAELDRKNAENTALREALIAARECVGGDDPSSGMPAPEDVWGIITAALNQKEATNE